MEASGAALLTDADDAPPGAPGRYQRHLPHFKIKKARLTHRQAQCGAITLIQRSGSALNLNIHYHMLVPDGVTEIDPPYFRTVSAPSAAELQALAQTISERIGRHLERTGKLVRDEESSYLALESEGEGRMRCRICKAIPFGTASLWVRTRAARPSCCRVCRRSPGSVPGAYRGARGQGG